jgi:hypothetical protein
MVQTTGQAYTYTGDDPVNDVDPSGAEPAAQGGADPGSADTGDSAPTGPDSSIDLGGGKVLPRGPNAKFLSFPRSELPGSRHTISQEVGTLTMPATSGNGMLEVMEDRTGMLFHLGVPAIGTSGQTVMLNEGLTRLLRPHR